MGAEVRKICLEGLLVAVIGAGLSLAANGLSPRGLKLARNYFPSQTKPAPGALARTNSAGAVAGTNVAFSLELLADELKAQGLSLSGSNDVWQLFHDPRYGATLLMVDARDDEHYQAGHIPGAYELEYFHPDKYMGEILAAGQAAEKIVVYCNGGKCDESKFAAMLLRDAGVPKEKLSVYGGGMGEWSTNGWPVEIGARNSGTLRPPTK